VACDFKRNRVRYERSPLPSSESLARAAIYESDAGAGAVNNNPYPIRDISVTVKYRCLSREHWLHSTAFSLRFFAPLIAASRHLAPALVNVSGKRV